MMKLMTMIEIAETTEKKKMKKKMELSRYLHWHLIRAAAAAAATQNLATAAGGAVRVVQALLT